MEPGQECELLASCQLGLISRHQAIERGLSASAIARLLRSGAWEALLPGVYAVRGVPRTREQDWLAAVLWAGDGSALSGLAAAAHWGFDGVENDAAPEIVTHRNLIRPGIIVHSKRRVRSNDLVSHRGILVTNPTLTLIETAKRLGPHRFERAAESCIRRRLTWPSLLAERNEEFGPGKAGRGVVSEFLRARHADAKPTDTDMEVLTLQAIRAARLPEPHRQYPVTIRGHRFRLDLAYPHRMIAIEYDSDSHHNGELQRQRDRWRQNLITSEGWRFVLVDKNQLRPGRQAFVRTLSRLLDCDQQRFLD